MASIILLGLERDLAEPLARILREQQHQVYVTNLLEDAVYKRDVQIVFFTGDDPDYRETAGALAEKRGDVAAVVVSRIPEASRWLDALELGAADYCGAPFEPIQMRWVVDSALLEREKAVA